MMNREEACEATSRWLRAHLEDMDLTAGEFLRPSGG